MPLKVIRRKDRGTLQIVGQIDGYKFIRKAAESGELKLAQEEAALLEARLIRERLVGPDRRADRPFAEIAEAYLKFEPRHPVQVNRVLAIVRALGNVPAATVDQEAIERLRDRLLRPNPGPATMRAQIITPIRAILNFGWRRKWCDKPIFELPKLPPSETRYFLPREAAAMVAAAAPHLRPILIFLFGTGARLGETLSLDWHEVDLINGRAIFLPEKTKTEQRRVATLPPAVVAALAALPHRVGPVFVWETNPGNQGRGRRRSAYAEREGGGQIVTAFRGALKRAGLDPRLHPHSTRHSWASWHYALYRDLLLLKTEGGWATTSQVERYAHLLPGGQEAAILQFWGYPAKEHYTAITPDLAENV